MIKILIAVIVGYLIGAAIKSIVATIRED